MMTEPEHYILAKPAFAEFHDASDSYGVSIGDDNWPIGEFTKETFEELFQPLDVEQIRQQIREKIVPILNHPLTTTDDQFEQIFGEVLHEAVDGILQVLGISVSKENE